MFGTALKLLAVGEASRQVGGYVNHMAKRYLILGVAGGIFLGALIFGTLAIYWKLISINLSPMQAALLMAGGLLLIALLTVLVAYGTTHQNPSNLASISDPSQLGASSLANLTAEDMGHHIEHAVESFGPAKVMLFAVAGGVIAGILSRRMPPQ